MPSICRGSTRCSSVTYNEGVGVMATPHIPHAIPAVTLTQDYWRDRGPFLARLHEQYGEIVRARLGQTEVVFLLGPAANRFVLLTHRQVLSYAVGWEWAFGQARCPRSLLTMDGAEHARHRDLLHPAFAARRIDPRVYRLASFVGHDARSPRPRTDRPA